MCIICSRGFRPLTICRMFTILSNASAQQIPVLWGYLERINTVISFHRSEYIMIIPTPSLTWWQSDEGHALDRLPGFCLQILWELLCYGLEMAGFVLWGQHLWFFYCFIWFKGYPEDFSSCLFSWGHFENINNTWEILHMGFFILLGLIIIYGEMWLINLESLVGGW